LEAQLVTAMEGLQQVVVRLPQDHEVYPQLVVLALTRVTGVLERMVSGRTKAHELERLLPWTWKMARPIDT
jgi:hypothetical protein